MRFEGSRLSERAELGEKRAGLYAGPPNRPRRFALVTRHASRKASQAMMLPLSRESRSGQFEVHSSVPCPEASSLHSICGGSSPGNAMKSYCAASKPRMSMARAERRCPLP